MCSLHLQYSPEVFWLKPAINLVRHVGVRQLANITGEGGGGGGSSYWGC